MSAIAESSTEKEYVYQVLVALAPGFDTLDFTGPLEVLHQARHDPKDEITPAFNLETCAPSQTVTSAQGLTITADMDYTDAHASLADYDILIIPGGTHASLSPTSTPTPPEPIPLLQAWATLQQSDPTKERTLLSISTGSLLLAHAGLLRGLAATTHPSRLIRLANACKVASAMDAAERTDVLDDARYVVNNARFDLGADVDENPFVLRRRPGAEAAAAEGGGAAGRRPSVVARKGSNAWKESRRRESNARRAALRLGGLRVITSGGGTAGMDAALYLVAAMVSVESATAVAEELQYTWQKGVTVEGIDV